MRTQCSKTCPDCGGAKAERSARCRPCYYAFHRSSFPSPEIRFWAFVDQSGGEDSCWNWTGGTSGVKRDRAVFHPHHGQSVIAARYVWEMKYGVIADGLLVCHECDNPLCCNPRHLFLGTHTDNVVDMVAKGRWRGPSGTNHKDAKLTELDVVEIRRLWDNRLASRSVIARRFNVSNGCIQQVVERRSWKHVA